MITLFIILWLIVGMSGFVYWWTTDFDFYWSTIPMAVFMGLCLGPFTWVAGSFIHSKGHKIVLLKSRKNK